jgi:GNAT superfamily N-acetyltransferase
MQHTFTDKAGDEVLIRLATEDDAVELIEFIKQVDTESLFLSREPGEFNVPVPTQRLFIRQTNARKNSLFLVALSGGRIVATIDFHGGTRQRALHTGEFGMSVRQSHWRRGIGAHLLDAVIAWARGNGLTKKIKLRVQMTNDRPLPQPRLRRRRPLAARIPRAWRLGGHAADGALARAGLKRAASSQAGANTRFPVNMGRPELNDDSETP